MANPWVLLGIIAIGCVIVWIGWITLRKEGYRVMK